MIRRVPILPSVIVAVAVGVMITLGIWQLERREWKEALIARYGQAQALPEVPWPETPEEREAALYRPASVTCDRVLRIDAVSGRAATGRPGWAHLARCVLDGGGEANIALGWSNEPQGPEWAGGEVTGIIGPAGTDVQLVASPPQAGLAQLAAPDPNDLPNNHLMYAMQWFFFAATAVGVYFLALQKRIREPR